MRTWYFYFYYEVIDCDDVNFEDRRAWILQFEVNTIIHITSKPHQLFPISGEDEFLKISEESWEGCLRPDKYVLVRHGGQEQNQEW